MNEKIRRAILAFQILPCMIMVSCGSGKKSNPVTETFAMTSVASFDYFDYKGMDDYYQKNPLPNEKSFYNPILPGWYSDPSICTNGEDYFMATSTFCYYPGVPLFHSKDLVNWKQIGHVLDRPSQLINMKGQGISGGIFAPAISYNPHNKTYYMITTNVGAGNFFVKTQDPFGSWSDPIPLPSILGIDPSFFFDEDGKAYIVNNDDAPDYKPEYSGHRTIRVQEFDVNTDKTIGERVIVVNKGVRPEEKPIWIEGPHIYKINGTYYLMSAEGGTSDWHSEVIFKGTSPFGPFVPWDKNPILTQRTLDASRENSVTCAGHADLIQAKDGKWWAVFLACRPINGQFENLGRETFMMPVQWSADSFPYMTQGDELVPMIVMDESVARGQESTFGNFEKKDEFEADKLGMEWMTLRAPADSLYSLIEKPGKLSLYCSAEKSTDRGTPAFVCRRMQHHKFECSTQMSFTPADSSERAGLALFKDETHQYLLSVKEAGKGVKVCVEKVSKSGIEELASESLGNDVQTIGLKITSDGVNFKFYYSTIVDQWNVVMQDVEAKYLSTAIAGGFTGTTIGMYAYK